jgi:serine/threonine protein kinase
VSGRLTEFQDRGCDVLGISTDDIETHARWLTSKPQDGGLGPISFPLAADPDGDICQKYGVYVERQRIALRGLFIIDPNGVLQYQVVHSLSVGRSTDEVLRVLDALQSGGLCPGERPVNGPTIDVMSSLQSGRIIGPYEIESELGSGSFGTVFRARDTLLNRAVALKILRRDDVNSNDSLLTEARAAAALNHPNVCTVHTIDTSNGAAMIVMEFIEGRSLSDIIEDGPLSTNQAALFGQQIAAGMASAHSSGVIHGDLKPGNLLVTRDGTIKIMDFGLARRMLPKNVEEETLPHTHDPASNRLSGTLGYLAPELAQSGEPSTASDTFAVGLVIYEMLTGERAITGNNILDALRCIEEFDATPFVAKVPEPFRTTLRQALARQPGERLTMSKIAEELAQ